MIGFPAPVKTVHTIKSPLKIRTGQSSRSRACMHYNPSILVTQKKHDAFYWLPVKSLNESIANAVSGKIPQRALQVRFVEPCLFGSL